MFRIPPITKNLLIINVLMFLALIVFEGWGIDLNNVLGLHFFLASDFHFYQLLTYMFMHANFTHILFNMFTLWMFGCVVESVWGPRKYLFYYIACGVGAGVIQMMAQFGEFYSLMNSAIAGFGLDDFCRWRTLTATSLTPGLPLEPREPSTAYCWPSPCSSPSSACSYSPCPCR